MAGLKAALDSAEWWSYSDRQTGDIVVYFPLGSPPPPPLQINASLLRRVSDRKQRSGPEMTASDSSVWESSLRETRDMSRLTDLFSCNLYNSFEVTRLREDKKKKKVFFGGEGLSQ